MFTQNDIKQFNAKGISSEKVEHQLTNFKKGFPYVNIIKAATINDGIIKLEDDKLKKYIKLYEDVLAKEKTVKFVPASGVASRMFKQLFEFKSHKNPSVQDKDFHIVRDFFQGIENFAFFNDLKSFDDKKEVLSELLDEKGLNYGSLPKGLLKFHKYNDKARTPAEEHLVEGAEYSNSNGKVNIHFTISPEHKSIFVNHIEEVKSEYERKYNVMFNIDFSVQKTSTDTIAVDLNNKPFRNEDGSILFRPAGHGALIENLDKIVADVIFVKNIDNVVPDKLKNDTITYKKAIAGVLIEKRNHIYHLIKKLEDDVTEEAILEAKIFLETEFFISLDNKFEGKTIDEKAKYLMGKLNRPVRVCGMVKNEGEPGGGPFFVKKESGSVSLQIVESAQIDMSNPEKVKIVENATHFNPVDLVLAVKDYKGNGFDLLKFIDFETGFISQKSKDGKSLKAQELPGLWNGAMAKWNTIFVEVPISTFNPVKVVNDLLRDTHQG